MRFTAVGSAKALIPEGDHILTLRSYDLRAVAFGGGDTDTADRVVWCFVSDQTDGGGNKYEYKVWTGTTYGSDKANLTALLDMLVPGMTRELSQALDPDELCGRRYKARVVHKVNEKTGRKAASHVYIIPLDDATASVARTVAAVSPQPVAAEREMPSWN